MIDCRRLLGTKTFRTEPEMRCYPISSHFCQLVSTECEQSTKFCGGIISYNYIGSSHRDSRGKNTKSCDLIGNPIYSQLTKPQPNVYSFIHHDVNVIVSTHIRVVCFPIAEQCLFDAMKRVNIIRSSKQKKREGK